MPGILKKCSCCAAKLEHRRKLCGRCKTPYCGPACQKKHWEEGGHDKLCKKIKKGGGAELYNADKKYKEAVAAAAKKCAEDTKGQTCYICMEAVHRRTGEGLVRGCACGDRDGVASGTTGIAHVSCLAEQAKILVAEAEENNLDNKALNEKWDRWHTCSLCKQKYHGVVSCALGWACWKTYLARPETDQFVDPAMGQLGAGLSDASQHEDALSVREAELSMMLRLGASANNILDKQNNIACTYYKLKRFEQALRMRQDVYSGRLKLSGEEHYDTLIAANNCAHSLVDLRRFEEAKTLLRKNVLVARRVLGESHITTLKMRWIYAEALYYDTGATLDDLREAATTLEDVVRTARRVLGGSHPLTPKFERALQMARTVLGAREAGRSVVFRKPPNAAAPGSA